MKIEERTENRPGSRRTNPVVGWIAIGLGVFMVVVGGLLLLWGLSYQATVGEPSDLEGNGTVGGPILIPTGVASIAFGSLWLYHGLKGFRSREEDLGLKKCPNCGRKIEEDLDFCYHCATTFPREKDEDQEGEEGERRPPIRHHRDGEGLTRGQKARLARQEERRRESKRKEEMRASPLEPPGTRGR